MPNDNVAFGNFIKVMDLCKLEGFNDIIYKTSVSKIVGY